MPSLLSLHILPTLLYFASAIFQGAYETKSFLFQFPQMGVNWGLAIATINLSELETTKIFLVRNETLWTQSVLDNVLGHWIILF